MFGFQTLTVLNNITNHIILNPDIVIGRRSRNPDLNWTLQFDLQGLIARACFEFMYENVEDCKEQRNAEIQTSLNFEQVPSVRILALLWSCTPSPNSPA